MVRDLRFAIRFFLRNRGFALILAGTMSLGIAGNTATFSLVNTILLKPLPYRAAGSLVWLQGAAPQRGESSIPISYPTYLDWREQARVFSSMAAYFDGRFYLTEGEGPELISGAWVAPELFSTLGVEALHGRVFRDEESRPAAERVVLVGYQLWQRRFGGDAALVGRSLSIAEQSYTVVGVMPPRFRFPEYAEIWTPLVGTGNEPRDGGRLSVVARLASVGSFELARTEMGEIARRLEETYPEVYAGEGVTLLPLRRYYVGDTGAAALVFLVVTGLVLILVCANLANLLLARAAGREREIALRAALGASRGRVVRQLLAENLLLALLGSGPGLLLGLWGLDRLVSSIPITLPFWADFGFDFRVLGFVAAVTVATGLIFGLVPALRTSRPDLSAALKVGAGVPSFGSRNYLTRLLVIAQVAVSLALLVAAGLMARGFLDLQRVEPGYEPEGVLTVRITLIAERYGERREQIGFVREVLEAVGGPAEVRSVGAASGLPVFGASTRRFTVEGATAPASEKEAPVAMLEVISPGYVETLEIPLYRGRLLNEADDEEAPLRAMVNRLLAERFWPEGDAVGRRLKLAGWDEEAAWIEVVGIVGDVRQRGVDQPPGPMVYLPFAQHPRRSLYLFVRTGLQEPAELAGLVRKSVRTVAPGVPVGSIRPLAQVVRESLWQPSVYSWLLGVFAALALVLAMLGVYGVIAWSVGQRTSEVGIRMALGARRADVLGLFLRQALGTVTVGLVLGLAAAVGLSSVLTGFLQGFASPDPLSLAILLGGFLLVAAAATLLPAGQAARIDPMRALRSE